MFCLKCNKELMNCTCEDLIERVEALLGYNSIYFTDKQKNQLLKRASKNKVISSLKKEND